MSKVFQNISVTGHTSQTGKKYVGFLLQGVSWFCLHQLLLDDPDAVFTGLKRQGLPLGRGAATQIMEEIQVITAWPETEIAEHVGANGPVWASPDGQIITPKRFDGADYAETGVGFAREPHRFSKRGEFRKWRKAAAKLADHEWVVFAMASALAPVIKGLLNTSMQPFGIAFIGSNAGPLRSLLQSVVGSTSPEHLAGDPFASLQSDPARFIAANQDHLLVVGDVGAYIGAGPARRRTADATSLFIDHLIALPDSQLNQQGQLAPMFACAEQTDVLEMLQLPSDHSSNLISIQVPANAFERPADDDIASAADLWHLYGPSLKDNFGTPLGKFVRRIIERRAKSLVALQKELDDGFAEFAKVAGKKARRAERSEAVTQPFALIATTLAIARKERVLPGGTIGAQQLVGNIFERWLAELPPPMTAKAEVARVAQMDGVLNLEDAINMTKKELQNVPGFIMTKGKGKRELWVLSSQKGEAFDWPVFHKLADHNKVFLGRGEKDRLGTKRTIGRWKDARVLRFRLEG